MTEAFDDIRDAETLARMEQVLPRVSPPTDLLDRILDEALAGGVVVPLDEARRRRSRTRVGLGAAVAVAAAIVLAFGISLSGGDGLGAPDARAAITSPTDPAVAGEARLYADDGKVVVSLTAVPPAPSGHHYEVWVLPAGSDVMISVGTFDTVGSEQIDLELTLPHAGRYAAVDVSVEEDDGPAEHSDTSYGSGAFA